MVTKEGITTLFLPWFAGSHGLRLTSSAEVDLSRNQAREPLLSDIPDLQFNPWPNPRRLNSRQISIKYNIGIPS